ncbi:UDP-N-acetylglucosamine 2-epimerase (non-hydrolyzing) [Sphingomonas sp. ASV193]|uniref:non-hydrolyzing UDP-N-acetylglucosamine 2-epimerase n=1 Tax=Sphingomonas sp. ASV193 TaxID=3144405 RepID=UPI0032E88C8A
MFAFRVGLVIGTRPEAIKMAPVAHALAARGVAPQIVLTGQHPGLDPSEHGLERYAVLRLGQPGLPHPPDHAERVAESLVPAWSAAPLDMVMVQGDTSSALGGARAAVAAGVPLAHVEAGLRTHDPSLPWPEESFRVEIDGLAQLLFAPTIGNAANLFAEKLPGEVHVTGNSGIDALLETRRRLRLRPREASRAGTPLRLLVTCHRRESWGMGLAMAAAALARLAEEGSARVEVVLHPNPRVTAMLFEHLGEARGVRLLPPLSHAAMIRAIAAADLVVSDSGGIQEEAPTLGTPLLVLREKTERPEAVACGNAIMVGTDPERIVTEVRRLFRDRAALATMARPSLAFGDGEAAPRIAEIAAAWIAAERHEAHRQRA